MCGEGAGIRVNKKSHQDEKNETRDYTSLRRTFRISLGNRERNKSTSNDGSFALFSWNVKILDTINILIDIDIDHYLKCHQ